MFGCCFLFSVFKHTKKTCLEKNSRKWFSIAFTLKTFLEMHFYTKSFFQYFFQLKASHPAKETTLSKKKKKKSSKLLTAGNHGPKTQTTSTHKANPPRSRRPQTYNNLIKSCPQNLDQSKFCVNLKKFDYLTFHFQAEKINRLPSTWVIHLLVSYSQSGTITQSNSMSLFILHYLYPSNNFFEIENSPISK